jgi:hypothetical protein
MKRSCAIALLFTSAMLLVTMSITSARAQQPIALAVDRDDSDDDGVSDGDQTTSVPTNDAVELVVPSSPAGPVTVSVLGGLRVLRSGKTMPTPFTLRSDELPAPLWLQAIEPSTGSRPLALLLARGSEVVRKPLHAVDLTFLDAQNRPLRPALQGLSISQRVTSDASLPRSSEHEIKSRDARNFRLQIIDSVAIGKRIEAQLESLGQDGRLRHTISLSLVREDTSQPFRSRFVRLVGDHVDRDARGVAGQVLLVGLRDTVRLVYTAGGRRIEQALRVGRPGDEVSPIAARQASLRLFVLRAVAGAAPIIGVDDASALRLVQDEIVSANEIWLQCNITFGSPAEVPVEIVDPPTAGFIAVANRDGLPARGGVIQLRADGKAAPAIVVPSGSTAIDTALRIAEALRSIGFDAQVTVNPKTVFGAASSADVVVRRRNGQLARIDAAPGTPITTDLQQRIEIGVVDLGDGLEEFDNMTAASGTLEERMLIKTLADDDPTTIDLFIINRFTHGTRQGEAFIEASAGAIGNAVILDRTGLRHRETAWTMAHEIGHVLLNQPLHPDNVGRDRPWLLMDSDNSRGTVNGPKRLTPQECSQARDTAGTPPGLLKPYDERSSKSAEKN